MTDRIHQEIVVKSAPSRVYGALTSSAEFARMTGGAPAEIDAQDGGAFSCFGGMIEGRNVECRANQRLVQAWRAKTWDPGVYSIVRMELRPEDSGTRLVLDHTGFPTGQAQHLDSGWHQNYWTPLKQHLE